jgi:hypothetical protein
MTEGDEILHVAVDAIEAVPDDMASRWTIRVDGVRMIDGEWVEFRGVGPSLVVALEQLTRHLRGVP